MKRSYLMHLMAVTIKGYEARQAGKPCVSPYLGRRGFNGKRSEAWRDGWMCADREIKSNTLKHNT